MIREKVVRLIALDARYRKEPYKDFPAWSETMATYVTGQHIIPADSTTRGNLTVAEMTGEKLISEEKAKRFPYIINPLNHVVLNHMQKFILSTDENGEYIDPRSKALFDYLQLQSYCGKHKGDVNSKVFYIEDEEQEAKVKTSKRDMIFNAMKALRECGREEVLDVALLLNHKRSNFYIDSNKTSYEVVLSKVMDIAEVDPDMILSCITTGAKEEIFAAKLHLKGIISRKGNAYFDGKDYLGEGLDGVVRYMKASDEKNRQKAARWSTMLRDIQSGVLQPREYNPEAETIKVKSDMEAEFKKKLDGFQAYMENVMKQTRVDILRKTAEAQEFPNAEWDTIDNLGEMRKYLIDKYKVINNLA